MRLKRQFGELRLVDAREPSVERTSLGLDLNQGFGLFVGDQFYFGDRAIHALALMSTRSGLFNRLNCFIFRHASLCRLLYPVLSTARRLLLFVLGRSLIE
jgi:hypothetical protein